MFRILRKWHKKICLIFFYGIIVFTIEYAIVYNNITETDGKQVQLLNNNVHIRRILNATMKGEFLAGLSNDTRRLPWTNVSSLEIDRSKLLMVQMRLTSCVQSGGKILKCLEDLYISERRGVILSDVKAQKQSISKQPPIRPAPINHKKVVPTIPTDDPKLVEEFYKRRSRIVNEYQYQYVLTPKRSCDADTFMVILVHSFHPYDDRRRAIRSTWGGAAIGSHLWPKRNITKKIKLFFMLGTHPLHTMNSAIREESEKYNDIIQGNFFDAYVNMTLKSLLGLKYVSEFCKDVQFLLKSDDDMIVNMPYLLQILQEKKLHRSIMGPLNKGSKVFRSGKWKIDHTNYPFRFYPPYESGSAYVITNDIVLELYNTSRYVKHFHVDDAYITGVLGKMIDVNHEQQTGFAFWTDKVPAPCDIINNKKASGTKMTPKKLEQFWQELHKDLSCL